MKKPRWTYRHNPAFPTLQRAPFELHPTDVEMLVGMLSIKKNSVQPWATPASIAVEGRHAISPGAPYTDYDLREQTEYHHRIWLKSLKFLQGLGYCQDSSGGLWAVVRDDLTMEIEA